AAAYSELAARDVDVAVIEAGLGGRWGATNVIPPTVQVLTTVGLGDPRWVGPPGRGVAPGELAGVRDGRAPGVGGGRPPGGARGADGGGGPPGRAARAGARRPGRRAGRAGCVPAPQLRARARSRAGVPGGDRPRARARAHARRGGRRDGARPPAG